MLRKTLLVLFSLFFSILCAQNKVIDSLKNASLQETGPIEHIDLLNYISEEYQEFNMYTSLDFAQRALLEAQNADYQEGLAYSYNNLGIVHDYLGQSDSSYLYYQKALKIISKLNAPALSAKIKNNLGINYMFKGNHLIALTYLQEALDESEDTDYLFDRVATLSNIGIIHEEMGQEEIALKYYQRSAAEAFTLNEPKFTAYGKLNIGYIAHVRNDYKAAVQSWEEALALYKRINAPLKMAETLYYLGINYLEMGAYELALFHHNEALKIYEEQDAFSDLPAMYQAIGEVYEKMDNPHRAIALFNRAVSIARKHDSAIDLQVLYKKLSESYSGINQFDSAYYYLESFQSVNDTIINQETRERIEQLEITYNLKVKEAENDKLLAEKAQREILLKQRTIMVWGISIITLLIGLIAFSFFSAYRRKGALNQILESKVAERTQELKAANTELRQSNEELERFTHIASHDLKEPLRGITSFLNLIQRKLAGRDDQDLKDYMAFVLSNTRQMYSLIEDVLAYSRIQDNEETAVEHRVSLEEIFAEVEQGLSVLISEQNATITTGHLPEVKIGKPHGYLILKNLIENGLKYNESEKPAIVIGSKREGAFHHVQVSDNGIGIDPAYQSQVFEMFKRLNTRDKYPGSGIGLAVCKKIVLKYGGQIWFSTNESKGTTFHFTVPAIAPIEKKEAAEML